MRALTLKVCAFRIASTRATVASVKGFAARCASTALILSFGLLAQASAYQAAFLTYGLALVVLGSGFAYVTVARRAVSA